MKEGRYVRSRRAFDAYCAMGEGELPADPVSRSQVLVHREGWPFSDARHGAEELVDAASEILRVALNAEGLLASALDVLSLLRYQEHDGLTESPTVDALRCRVAGAVAGAARGLMAICTTFRLDFGELCRPGGEE